MATTTLAKPNRVPRTRKTICSDGSSSAAVVRPSTVSGFASGSVFAMFVVVEVVDDVAVFIDSLVMRVDASTIVRERTGLVGSKPDVELGSVVCCRLTVGLAAAAAAHASSRNMEIFEIAIVYTWE